jgi:hypothetical protein
MKKTILIFSFFIAFTSICNGQMQIRNVYNGQILDGRPDKKILIKLDINFEGMSMANLKPYEVTDVFIVKIDKDTVFEMIGKNHRFVVTDDNSNRLELKMYTDDYNQVLFKGIYNGEAFHSENDKIIYDESKKKASINYKIH